MKKKWKGITYQERKKQRKGMFEHKSSPSVEIEKPENAEFHVYFGRAHLKDFETSLEVRGKMKIGRGKFTTAIQRGRNQPGVDFRLYCILEFYTNEDTWLCEKIIKNIYSSRNTKGEQGQMELYDFDDWEIPNIVKEISRHLKDNKIKIKSKQLFS